MYEGAIQINPIEVKAYAYQSMKQIAANLEKFPQQYTAWFHLAFPKVYDWFQQSSL